jgi:hypothetical protein
MTVTVSICVPTYKGGKRTVFAAARSCGRRVTPRLDVILTKVLV